MAKLGKLKRWLDGRRPDGAITVNFGDGDVLAFDWGVHGDVIGLLANGDLIGRWRVTKITRDVDAWDLDLEGGDGLRIEPVWLDDHRRQARVFHARGIPEDGAVQSMLEAEPLGPSPPSPPEDPRGRAMTYEAMLLELRDLDGEYRHAGILLRGEEGLLFDQMPGNALAGELMRARISTARDHHAEDALWEYLEDRGLGAYSSFSEPFDVTADDIDRAVDAAWVHVNQEVARAATFSPDA